MIIGLIGFGAIGHALVDQLHADGDPPLVQVLVRYPERVSDVRVTVAASRDDLLAARPALVVECAGHDAVREHGAAVLAQGSGLLLASVGALADPVLEGALRSAAAQGRARLHLPAGALGGLDLIAAARPAGLEEVRLTSSKAPAAWRGSPAEQMCDLAAVTARTVFFSGTARDAARHFPANANVAAAIALAGMGLDQTQVELAADPSISRNRHQIMARGAFGSFEAVINAEPLPSNPRSSWLAALSLARAVRNLSTTIVI